MNEYVIINETDKDGIEYTVKIASLVKNSSVEQFSKLGWEQLKEDGFVKPNRSNIILDNASSVFLEHENKVVACCIFGYGVELLRGKFTEIIFTLVEPSYRGKGLASILFKYIEKISRINESSYIKSTVHVNHVVQQKVAESQGRKVAWYIYEKKLK